MAGLSAQMTRVHEEIDQKVRNHPDVRSLLNEAKALAEKEQLHEELAECFLAEMHLLVKKEDKDAERQLVESAIGSLKKALEAASVPKRRGHVMGKLSGLYRELGKKTEAASWLRRAGEIFEKGGDVFGLANFQGSMAELHRSEGRQEDEIASYRKVLELIEGRSFHHLAAGARINLAGALRFRRDFPETQALLTEAEAICDQHRLKDFITAIARNRSKIETELNAGQAASHTLPQLLCSLHQLLRYRPENATGYLAFWFFAWKTELMALLRSGSRLSLMVVTDDVDRFMAFAEKVSNLADYFVMATTQEPTVAAEGGILAIPPSWRFPVSFPLFTKREEQRSDGSEQEEGKDLDDGPPNIHMDGPATMLPPYMLVEAKASLDGEGHMMPLTSPYLPNEAITLMTQRPVKELIRRRAVWFPTLRFNSRDPFLTDLRVAHERGVFPVYFDRLPTFEAVTACGGVSILVPASFLESNSHEMTAKWRRALIKITRLAKDEAQTALLDLPDTFTGAANTAIGTHFEVHLFEFKNVDRMVVRPALLFVQKYLRE
jgi:tetratricopeptide (TPR) repeat protein